MTLENFHKIQEVIVKAFLKSRDMALEARRAQGNFWAHTKESKEFYAKWDRKFEIITKYLNRKFHSICREQLKKESESANLLEEWRQARQAFRNVAYKTPLQTITGGGWDRCARMWNDFDKIIKHMEQ
jgi:hypothetical protein